jgi:hypothetical protein
MKQSYEAQI